MPKPPPKAKAKKPATKPSHPPPAAPAESKLSAFQKFEIRRVHRSLIKEAPYNPRTIDEWGRKKLKDGVRELGLIETLVWNERTGHLVGGHQRLSVLDELEGGVDYELDVAVVSLSLKREKEANVRLNNPTVGGTYDLARLADLLHEESFSMDAAGLDTIQVEDMFAGTELVDSLFADAAQVAEVLDDANTLADIGEGRAAAKRAPDPSDNDDDEPPSERPARTPKEEAILEERKRVREKTAELNEATDTEFYVVVVLGSREDREALMRGLGRHADDKYVDGRMLMAKLGIEPAKSERL